jgi:hypothetical protein
MFIHRMAAVTALVFGAVGIAGCVAGAYGVWRVKTRLEEANDKLFEAVDRSLVAVLDRVPLVREKVKQSELTTTEVTERVREWGVKTAQDRIALKLQVEAKAEKLSSHLRTAELRLEASRDAAADVRRMLEVGRRLGGGVDPGSMDAAQDRIESLLELVRQVDRTVDGVRNFADGDPAEDKVARVTTLLARILLTLSDVDRRLDEFADRLSEVRDRARQVHVTNGEYIVWGSVVCYVLLIWVGAGQAALCWCGWRSLCRRSPAGES